MRGRGSSLFLHLSFAHAAAAAKKTHQKTHQNPPTRTNDSDAPAEEAVAAAEEEDVVEDFEPIERLQEVGIAAREFSFLAGRRVF